MVASSKKESEVKTEPGEPEPKDDDKKPSRARKKLPQPESMCLVALKTVLLAIFIFATILLLFVGIPLVCFMGLSRPDTVREYLEDRLADPRVVRVNAPQPKGDLPPFQRRQIDWAYSTVDLTHLASLEEDLYKEFGNSAFSKNDKSLFGKNSIGSDSHKEIQSWIHDYKASSLRMTKDIPEESASKRVMTVVNHPYLSLRMIKRYSKINDILKSALYAYRPLKETDFFKKFKLFASEVIFPNQTDVENIMRSILEIQFMYDFQTDELIRGNFGDIATKFGLRLDEAYELGMYAYKVEMYPEALDWLQTVHDKLNQSNSQQRHYPQLSPKLLFDKILEVTNAHDLLLETIKHDNYYDRYHRFTNKIISIKKLLTLKEEDTIRFLKSKDTKYYPAYSLLCSGKDFLSERKRAKLRCWNEHKSNLAWLINPLKMEVLSWNPYLVQIHDAVGEKFIKHVQESTHQDMERTYAPNYTEKHSTYNSNNATKMLRTAFSAVLFEQNKDDAAVLHPFERKIERMTQLAVSNVGIKSLTEAASVAEQLQVSSYVFGGQFSPHLDAHNLKDEFDGTVGDRVATFMVYLNNVKRGGYTTFPELGISVVPERGSALFWYNLFKNGTTDPRTLHAGCPVILGQKWIATKWIRYKPNFLTRKCSRNALE